MSKVEKTHRKANKCSETVFDSGEESSVCGVRGFTTSCLAMFN